MKTGIFGGSFDPPHVCHVLACLYVLETTDTEKILVIPCYKHPFDKNFASFQHRLEMCRLAFSPIASKIEISDIEAERKNTSYTIDTVRELIRLRPNDQFRLIIGSDILHETNKWKDFEQLKQLAEPIVVPRLSIQQASEESPRFYFPDLSSTDIRKRLAQHEPVQNLIPRSVLQYIQNHNLYS